MKRQLQTSNRNKLWLELLILFLLVAAGIFFTEKIFAQTVNATNTGNMFVNSGTIVSFEGSFTNTAAGTHKNEGYEYIKGNWINNGTYDSEDGKVTFWGSTVQNISGSVNTNFFNAEINNSSGVTLSQTVNVAGTLGLVLGNITTYAYEVNVSNSLTNAINPYSESSYIVGNLRRSVTGLGDYAYPVGTSIYYELANLDLNNTTGFTDVLGYFTNAVPNPTALPAGLKINGTTITDMLNYGYWTLTPNSSLVSGNFTVKLNMRGATNTSSPASIYGVIERTNSSSNWTSQGTHVNSTQYISSGTVHVERSAVNVSSDYGIGFPSLAFPLPIELLSFNAHLNADEHVDLSWVTASEQNSDHFTVERSSDGILFTDLLYSKAAGFSNHIISYSDLDREPLFGISYYRLRQTDFNGEIHYSQIDKVYLQSTDISFSVLPNPTTADNIHLKISGANNSVVQVLLIDAVGKKYFSKTVSVNSDQFFLQVTPSIEIAAGYYHAEVYYNGKIYSKPVVVL